MIVAGAAVRRRSSVAEDYWGRGLLGLRAIGAEGYWRLAWFGTMTY